MKGTISAITERSTAKGPGYDLRINGEWLSIPPWEAKVYTDARVVKGDEVEYEITPGKDRPGGGTYNPQITSLKKLAVDPPHACSGGGDRQTSIIRQTCVKCAAQVFTGNVAAAPADILRYADEFYAWVTEAKQEEDPYPDFPEDDQEPPI